MITVEWREGGGSERDGANRTDVRTTKTSKITVTCSDVGDEISGVFRGQNQTPEIIVMKGG